MTPPNLTPTPSTAVAGLRLSPSALVLVAANLVPLAGVLFFGWSVFATLLLFWVENVIVGGFNILRMLWAQPDNPLMWVAKAGTIPFFIVHYGMFTTVHGVFVLTLFGGMHERGFPGPTEFLHAVQGAGIWPAAGFLGRMATGGLSVRSLGCLPCLIGYNDIGILTAPDGRSYAVAVMIKLTSVALPVRMLLMNQVVRTVIAQHDLEYPATAL